MHDCIYHLAYMYFKTNPDMWMGLVKRDDGRDYYEYMLIHVGESLAVGDKP